MCIFHTPSFEANLCISSQRQKNPSGNPSSGVWSWTLCLREDVDKKISLTLQSFVSWDGFKWEHSKEDVLVIWKQRPACCRFFVSAVKALLGAGAICPIVTEEKMRENNPIYSTSVETGVARIEWPIWSWAQSSILVCHPQRYTRRGCSTFFFHISSQECIRQQRIPANPPRGAKDNPVFFQELFFCWHPEKCILR